MFIIANPVLFAFAATMFEDEAVTVAVVGAEAVRAVFVETCCVAPLFVPIPGFCEMVV